jgi:hypothetical protein
MATKKKPTDKPKKGKGSKKPADEAATTEAKAPPGDQPNLRIETFMAEQPCKLSDEDVKQRSKLAAKLVAKRDKVRETAKSESKARRLEIQGIEEQIRTTSQEVREEVTHRMVKCERHFNYDTKRVTDIRLDTGEITGTPRDMTDAELQTFFNFDEPLPPPAGGSAEDDLDNEFGGGDAEDEDEADPR